MFNDQPGHTEETGIVSIAGQEKNEPDISVLIVGYMSKDLMLDCLSGLFQHTIGPTIEVLYVDCSNDGSVQAVREQFPSIRVIDNDQNLGFARGNNLLAHHARGGYLLLLNPDTIIRDNAIGELFDFAKRTPDAGAWGGVTRLPNGAIDPSCQQSGPGLCNALLLLLGMGAMASPDVLSDDGRGIEVPSLSGAFMMMPRDLWQQLGGFDESFFMYCEETDLCYRVLKAGRRVLMTSRSSVVHLVGSGSSKSPKRMLALTRGGVHLTRKHYGKIYLFFDITIRWLYSASRYMLGLVGRPLIGAERAAELRARHAPVVMRPSEWIHGWNSANTTMPKPETKAV